MTGQRDHGCGIGCWLSDHPTTAKTAIVVLLAAYAVLLWT